MNRGTEKYVCIIFLQAYSLYIKNAARHGVEPAAVVYAWIMYHPVKGLPMVGSGRLDRLDCAIRAFYVKLNIPNSMKFMWQAASRESDKITETYG